jgi:integrase
VSRLYEGKRPPLTKFEKARSAQFGRRQATRSVQELSKAAPPTITVRYAKTDLRYWLAVTFRQTYARYGSTRRVRNWAAKIQHAGRRETFNLGTPNKTAAASRARQIYLSLQSSGWEVTVGKFKPKPELVQKVSVTVGEFLREIKTTLLARPKTIESYCRAFRMIVANICGIEGGPEKYDYVRGGREQWLARINAIKLREITPDKVHRWKIQFIRRAGNDPVKQRAARISANSLMRQAKSLFSPKILKFVRLDVKSTPFEGVPFEPRQSMRYRSSFDVVQLISLAQQQLPIEQLKIFLLAIMAGLRRNEIDKLEWSAFREIDNIIRIEPTRYFQPKTEDSSGDVEVDAQLMSFFRRLRARATKTFVINSDVRPRVDATYSHYRCNRHFTALTKWLQRHGVGANRPLHTLRKEYGSQMCAKHGIYAASYALRHSDIGITSQHYLDRRRRATLGFGKLLKEAARRINQK